MRNCYNLLFGMYHRLYKTAFAYYRCILITLFSVCGIATAVFGQSQMQTDSIWSYDKIRMDSNQDDTLDYLGREVKITGVANIASGLLHEHYLQAFVQNDSAGMSIFAMDITQPFEVGDSLVATGEIRRYNGLAEVHINSYQVFDGVSGAPSPKSLEKAIYNPQKYLGMLVKGEGKIIEKGTVYNGKYLRISPSDTARASMMVYVSNFHHLYKQFDFDVLSIGDKISVRGIITEYNPDFPEQRTYKLFLRTPEDLEYADLPRYYWMLFIGGLVVISIVVGVWIMVLRRQVEKKTQDLQQSLEEKEVLLREIHHRIKNSLSILSGLIGLQMDSTEDRQAQSVLQDSQSRIQSMALIHDKLYQTDSLSDIKLDEYLQELVEAIHGTFVEFQDSVELRFQMEQADIDIDKVVPCGLLINELVVNAFKHAFTPEKEGVLEISLEKNNGQVELEVADNGPGLPEDFTLDSKDSLGSMLIKTFATQLQAETEIKNREGGTAFKFTFSVN